MGELERWQRDRNTPAVAHDGTELEEGVCEGAGIEPGPERDRALELLGIPDEPMPAPLGSDLAAGERTDPTELDAGQREMLGELRALLMQIAPARPGYHVGAILGVIVFEPDLETVIGSLAPVPPGPLMDLVVEPQSRLGDLIRALREFPLEDA